MRHIERAPLLVVGAIGLTFALVGADSCSGGGGGGGASTSTSTSTSTPSSSATAPAPQASSITGTIDPTSSIVGEPVTMTFDLSGFNQAIPDLSFDTSGDLHNQHTVDSVTISLDGGAPAACNEDPKSMPAYTCGAVAQGQKARDNHNRGAERRRQLAAECALDHGSCRIRWVAGIHWRQLRGAVSRDRERGLDPHQPLTHRLGKRLAS